MVDTDYEALMGESEIELFGSSYELADMGEDEINYFDVGFDIFLGTTDSVLRKIYNERKSVLFQGVRAVKKDLDNPKFRGLNPNDTELGMSQIRPGHVKGWNRLGALRAAGNVLQDLIGWGMYYPLPRTWYDWLWGAAANTGFTLSEDHGILVAGLSSFRVPAPVTSEIEFTIGRTALVPYAFRDIELGDNENQTFHIPVPTMFVLSETEFLARVMAGNRAMARSVDELRIFGLTVGLGRFLKQELYAGIW